MKERSSGKLREVGPWSEQTSSSGKKYYYNHETEISQWEKPSVWREYEKKITEEKDRHRQPLTHDNAKPSTSYHHNASKESAGSLQSPFQGRNSYNPSKVREREESTGLEGPPIKRPFIPADKDSPKDVPTQGLPHLPSQTSIPTASPLLPQAPPPPVLPQEALTSRCDEPMDVATSPPQDSKEAKSSIHIPVPSVRPFDEAKYHLFYKPSNCSSLRKSLGAESSQLELKRTQEKLHKSRMALMELETSIISVQSLLFTAEAKSALLSEKFSFLDNQMEAIKHLQFKTETNSFPVSSKSQRIDHTNGTKGSEVTNGKAS
uniref:WW domain-containing protein n=1 Tax=Bursaphelenchus xylophilus TaxID=6326 RepID=A0A1I7RY93_BURXY